MVAAQSPSASEYQRAKAAISNMIGNSQDLPRCIRLGKSSSISKKCGL